MLYYNKEYFTEEDVKSFDKMLEIARENGKKIAMDFTSGWYLYSFFKGAGLNVELSEDGLTNICDWNTTEGKYKGVDVAEAMCKIAANAGFLNCGDADFVAGAKDGSIIAGINGAWNAKNMQEAYGDNYAAAKLPEYSIAGDSVQMHSFAGYKLVGVNAYTKNAKWAQRLAQWITNEENQMIRFERKGDCPSNVNAAASKKVIDAPAIAAQFRTAPGQLESALKIAGFAKVWEVAVGADITAEKEAHEFEERMERGDIMMTTSCCPAYVRAVHIHVPDLSPCISDTRSPMHYTAKLAKEEDPDCVAVFIGPCLAKRREGMDDEYVDYVLSVEEIGALFIAMNIDVAQQEHSEPEGKISPTASARNFAVSGGVAESVRIRLKDPSILKPAVINGLNKIGMKQLAGYGKINVGKMPHSDSTPNLVEVMACEGGCIAGPCVVTNPKVAAVQLKKYVEAGGTFSK